MEDKYYTPSIEEFRFGFEYEMIPSIGVSVINLGDPTEKFETRWATDYRKAIFGIQGSSPFGEGFPEIKAAIRDNKIRVKLLDKEDIESLGWINTEHLPYNVRDCWFFTKGEYKLYKSFTDNLVYISTRDVLRQYDEKGNPKPRSLFCGYIKNISELKILLKQLGVE